MTQKETQVECHPFRPTKGYYLPTHKASLIPGTINNPKAAGHPLSLIREQQFETGQVQALTRAFSSMLSAAELGHVQRKGPETELKAGK